MKEGKHLTILGCGGNIGSQLVSLLARLRGICKLTLVDCDRYEAKNLSSQNITRSDIARPKAIVQARNARRYNPALEVEAIHARFQSVPIALLRSDVILTCLDSKGARANASEVSSRLNTPLIDAGIEPSLLLARVDIYVPGPDQPCFQCSWDERDYAQLSVRYPCDGEAQLAPPTNAPAALGALAASLQAIECQKLLEGDFSGAGKQVVIEARTHKHYVTVFRRNPRCRFDHRAWSHARLISPELSLASALKLAKGGEALAFGGKSLARRLDCPACGFIRESFRIFERLSPREKRCPRCGEELMAAGFYSQDRLISTDLTPAIRNNSLASLGFRSGDIISVSKGRRETFFELTKGNFKNNL